MLMVLGVLARYRYAGFAVKPCRHASKPRLARIHDTRIRITSGCLFLGRRFLSDLLRVFRYSLSEMAGQLAKYGFWCSGQHLITLRKDVCVVKNGNSPF